MQNTKYVRLEPFFDIGNFGVQEIVSGGAAVRAVCASGVCRMYVAVRTVQFVRSTSLKCMGTTHKSVY